MSSGDPGAIPPGPWDSWLERDRDVINVERAVQITDGRRSDMPPAMLKAIGLA